MHARVIEIIREKTGLSLENAFDIPELKDAVAAVIREKLPLENYHMDVFSLRNRMTAASAGEDLDDLELKILWEDYSDKFAAG